MVDQFEAEKCLHAALTDNLYFDNRQQVRAPGNSDGRNPGIRAASRCKIQGVAWEMLALGID